MSDACSTFDSVQLAGSEPRRRAIGSRVGRKAPRHLFAIWSDVKRSMRSADQVALFLDFDGTLAPIAPWPDQVRFSPRNREQLASIAKKDITFGVVSGRRLADLRARIDVGGIWYVGEHGYFFSRSSGPVFSQLDPMQKKEMAQISRRLAAALQGVPGVWLEPKQATVAIHYRHASGLNYRKAFAAIRGLLQDHPHLHLLPGKKVWELFPNPSVNKWTAMRQILKLEQGNGGGGRWLVFYLGDDSMDERVFSQMQGISVVVGRHRRTAAEFFLESPAEVGKFLERFSEAVK